jgi:hypothetical protein
MVLPKITLTDPAAGEKPAMVLRGCESANHAVTWGFPSLPTIPSTYDYNSSFHSQETKLVEGQRRCA